MDRGQTAISLSDDPESDTFHQAFDPHWFDTARLSIYATGVAKAGPYLLCGLAAASHWYAEQGRPVRFHSPYAPVHLEQMRFFEALSSSTSVSGRGATSKAGKTNSRVLLPLRRILEDASPDQVVTEFLENTRDAQGWLQGVGLQLDQGYIVELLGNALEHANSEPGCFVASSSEGSAGPLSISIVDLGIGIPGHLRQRELYRDLSDEEALREAINEGVSGIDDKYRGFGLHHARSAAADSGRDCCAFDPVGRNFVPNSRTGSK